MNLNNLEMEQEPRHAKITGIITDGDMPLITFGDVGIILILSIFIGLAVGLLTMTISFIFQVFIICLT